jgi:hypothetical protein
MDPLPPPCPQITDADSAVLGTMCPVCLQVFQQGDAIVYQLRPIPTMSHAQEAIVVHGGCA